MISPITDPHVVHHGALDAPTLLDRLDPSMTLVREETFGPISPVIVFDTLDDSTRIGNGAAVRITVGCAPEPAGRDQAP